MHPIDEPDGRDHADAPDREAVDARMRDRLDRRAEALRANLKRRKAQIRGRAAAEAPSPARD